MDCWWNEAVEDQAIDRVISISIWLFRQPLMQPIIVQVHRIGQQRPVQVTKLIVRVYTRHNDVTLIPLPAADVRIMSVGPEHYRGTYPGDPKTEDCNCKWSASRAQC
jgi:hypothetical protein